MKWAEEGHFNSEINLEPSHGHSYIDRSLAGETKLVSVSDGCASLCTVQKRNGAGLCARAAGSRATWPLHIYYSLLP